MSPRRRTLATRIAAVSVAALAALSVAAVLRANAFGVGAPPAAAASISQLNSQLGAQQARQQSLSSSISSNSHLIASLDSQIALVQSREEVVRSDLARERADLAATQASLARERARLALLRARLARARMLLSRQLVSSYERDRPDIVAVVLDAHGFTDLLENLDFLHRAESQQQTIIAVTREAKTQADSAARRLAKLEAADRQIAAATAVRANALAGMNALLGSKQSALAQARAVQRSALAASRARGQQLRSAISRLQAQQAAAQRAAANAVAPSSSGSSSSGSSASGSSASGSSLSGPALGPSGGWAIPYAIVLCESGGQNLPPNSAGASGYYQIIPSTWTGFGGTGPAAYLASKSEQDAVASRIWNGGAGASNWACAGIVGIH
jgi:septal ring factor EnvC (AmiA/AmiB activator)